MYKDIFINKKLIIFDLNSILEEIHELWRDSIQNVLDNNHLGHLNGREAYVIGRHIKTAYEYLSIDSGNKINKHNIEDFINQTYKEFINIIKVSTDLNTKSGFEDFINELKSIYNPKIILKSPYIESVTSAMLENYYLSNTFHQIEITPIDEIEKDLYKDILKTSKVKPEKILAVEESLQMANRADNQNIETIIMWDKETPREKYPSNTIMFVDNFDIFLGHLDKTYLEELEIANNYL